MFEPYECVRPHQLRYKARENNNRNSVSLHVAKFTSHMAASTMFQASGRAPISLQPPMPRAREGWWCHSYEPHVTDRPGRTETTFPNHGDAVFLIKNCQRLDLQWCVTDGTTSPPSHGDWTTKLLHCSGGMIPSLLLYRRKYFRDQGLSRSRPILIGPSILAHAAEGLRSTRVYELLYLHHATWQIGLCRSLGDPVAVVESQ